MARPSIPSFALLLFCWLIGWSVSVCAQDSLTTKQAFDVHYERAIEFDELSMYAAAIQEVRAAIEIAYSDQALRWEHMNATITLAELMRKTRDFHRGIELLQRMSGVEAFPDLHVRYIGRLAALYHEATFSNTQEQWEKVDQLLTEGLALAEKHQFMMELAGLKNEMATLIMFRDGPELALPLFEEATSIALAHGDTLAYASIAVHIVDAYQRMGLCEQADSMGRVLLEIVAPTNWYSCQVYLYDLFAHEAGTSGDSLSYYRWKNKSLESRQNVLMAINSNQMASFRVLQETDKFKDRARASARLAELNEQRLNDETRFVRILWVFLALLILSVIGVVALLLRERRLKAEIAANIDQLNEANERYHLLLVESNHRIKNNLQMVISMLEYVGKDEVNEQHPALKRISGKIHTISALHKHLYLDVHNDFVDLGLYFRELLDMYDDLSYTQHRFITDIAPIRIRSERIVYFGLILNEMLTNSFSHAAHRSLEIRIDVSGQGGGYQFMYQDGSSWDAKATGLGTNLIRMLVRRVGGREYVNDTLHGAYTFEFDV